MRRLDGDDDIALIADLEDHPVWREILRRMNDERTGCVRGLLGAQPDAAIEIARHQSEIRTLDWVASLPKRIRDERGNDDDGE